MTKTQKPISPLSASLIEPDYNGVKENNDHPPHDVMKSQMAGFLHKKDKNHCPSSFSAIQLGYWRSSTNWKASPP